MNKKNEITSVEDMVNAELEHLEKELVVEEKQKKKMPNKSFFLMVIVSLTVCTILGYLITTVPAKNAKSNYDDAVENAYTNIYEKSYVAAKERWHVSNIVDIEIDEIKETANLQVLKVYDVEYVMNNENEDGVISCLEVTGSGDFTVDLLASEFVVDNERKYVRVRIPNPVLKNCTIDNRNILVFKDGLFNGSTGEGIELAEEDLKEAAKKIEVRLASNVSYYEKAKGASITAIENIVKEFNPDVVGLKVEVEFFE